MDTLIRSKPATMLEGRRGTPASRDPRPQRLQTTGTPDHRDPVPQGPQATGTPDTLIRSKPTTMLEERKGFSGKGRKLSPDKESFAVGQSQESGIRGCRKHPAQLPPPCGTNGKCTRSRLGVRRTCNGLGSVREQRPAQGEPGWGPS